MAIVQQTVSVESNSLAVGQALAKFIGDVKSAFASGSKIEEVAAVAQAGLVDLLPALSSINQVVSEAKADPMDEAMTVFLVGTMVYKSIMGQK
jgi:hypothetical protein